MPPLRSLKLFPPRTLALEKHKLHYFVHSYSGKHADFRPQSAIGSVRLEHGKLFVGKLPVLKPYFGHDMVSWSQRTKNHFTSGHLTLARKGTELHGVICQGPSAAEATIHHVVATTVANVPYNTSITKIRYPVGTDPNSVPPDGWQDGLVLQIGYEQQVGGDIPVPVVILDDQDISTFTTWSIDPKTSETQLLLSLDPSLVCDFDSDLYLDSVISFNIFQPLPTFSGTITSTCADQKGSGVYLWKGQATAAHAALAAHFASPPISLTAADVVSDPNLSLADLMSIVPDDSVMQQANDMLTENMKWALGNSSDESSWLGTFFGENQPVIDADRQKLVNQDLDWYQGDFAKSYLGWSLTNYAGPGAPSVNLNDDQKLQLKYFLQTGLAKTPAFNTQQNGIYVQAFLAAQPKLDAYSKDTGGNWAQQLYDVITSPPQFTLMINRVFGTSGVPGSMTAANNFSTLLTVLDASGELAKKYYQAVTTGTLASLAHQTTWKDKDTVMEWLPDFLQEFLNQIATRGTIPDEAKIAGQQLQAMLEQMGGSMANLAGELADFVINANGADIMQKTQNAQSAFLNKYPKFAAVGKMLFFAGWCMGIVYVVKAFQNWDNLSKEDKAKAVLGAIDLGFEALDVVPTFILGVRDMGLTAWNKFQNWRNGPPVQEEMIEMNELKAGDAWVENGVNEATPLLDGVGKTVKTAGTTWELISSSAAKIVAVVGMAVSAAFAVMSTIDFVNDLNEGQPVTKEVFDGIMMSANIATTICLVLDLFVATSVFAMAAAVLAVVGVIVAIVEMFVAKPKNPLDDFMGNVIIPFVSALPPQTPPPGATQNLQVFAAVAV